MNVKGRVEYPGIRVPGAPGGRRMVPQESCGRVESSVFLPHETEPAATPSHANGGGDRVPLPWVRLDTAMPGNAKVLHLIESHREGRAAAFVWLCSIAYSGEQGTDGFISRSALTRCNGTAMHARLLVEHQFWKDEGIGWTIHDFRDYQPSTEETQRRSERARLAAFKRWGKQPPP